MVPTAGAGDPADAGPGAPARAAGRVHHLVTGLGVLVSATLLAIPTVWWTATRATALAEDMLNQDMAGQLATTTARVDAGELPPEVLDGPWEVFAADPLAPTMILMESLPLGAAALAGYLLAGRPARGRLTAMTGALLIVLWALTLRLLDPGLLHLGAGAVPPLTWDGVMAPWHAAPRWLLMLPALVMGALVVAGGLVARPATPVPRHRRSDVVVGSVVAVAAVAVVGLDRAAATWWTWSSYEGLAVPVLLLSLVAWLAADSPATPVLAPTAMLATAAPYVVEGFAGMTVVHLGVTSASVGVVALAGLRRPMSRALTRLLT